jgi:hypothetical protein
MVFKQKSFYYNQTLYYDEEIHQNAVLLVFCYNKPNIQYLIKVVLYHSSTSSQFSFESVMVLSRIKDNGNGYHFYQQDNYVGTFLYFGGLGRLHL